MAASPWQPQEKSMIRGRVVASTKPTELTETLTECKAQVIEDLNDAQRRLDLHISKYIC